MRFSCSILLSLFLLTLQHSVLAAPQVNRNLSQDFTYLVVGEGLHAPPRDGLRYTGETGQCISDRQGRPRPEHPGHAPVSLGFWTTTASHTCNHQSDHLAASLKTLAREPPSATCLEKQATALRRRFRPMPKSGSSGT